MKKSLFQSAEYEPDNGGADTRHMSLSYVPLNPTDLEGCMKSIGDCNQGDNQVCMRATVHENSRKIDA